MADLFQPFVAQNGSFAGRLKLEIREDRCFPQDEWLSVGDLVPRPESNDARPEGSEGSNALLNCLRYGFYEWHLPCRSDLEARTASLLTAGEGKKGGKSKPSPQTLREASRAVVHVAIRCGLAHPVFDAAAVESMPFTKPATVVVDTSAVLQGGLDFLVRHLAPQARIKVPALVHMEVLNLGERYFSLRRNGGNKARMLQEHARSQGAQSRSGAGRDG